MKPNAFADQRLRRDRGVALVFVLLMLAIALTAALFAARSTLLGEKAARNDRDRQVAFQAAELALGDAELDIMDAERALQSGSKSRGCKFGNPASGLVAEPGCSADPARRGLCGITASSLASPSTPIYEQIDWEDTDDGTRAYVKYGEFTGRTDQFKTGDNTGSDFVARPSSTTLVASPARS